MVQFGYLRLFRHWNCFPLSVLADDKTDVDWNLNKLGQHSCFQVFLLLCLQKSPKNNDIVSALDEESLFDIFLRSILYG